MRAGKLRQLLLISSQIVALIALLSICAPAQAPNPSPSPAPASSPSASGKTFSENLAALAIRAAELIPVLQSEVESPLLNWFEKISIVLAVIIVMFSFARLWRDGLGCRDALYLDGSISQMHLDGRDGLAGADRWRTRPFAALLGVSVPAD